jgi:nucleoside-diphosphate-sugar epimerase
MRVLISGCGDLGTEAGLLLAAQGHEVYGLRRDPTVLPPQIRPVPGDLTTDEGLEQVPDGVELLVHTPTAGGRDPERYAAVYRDGLERLLERLSTRGAPLRRALFVSSTTVYGDAGGGWVDEDTPTDPASATGEQIVAAEQVLLSADVEPVVLRLAGIYGPGRTRQIDKVRSGEAVLPTEPRHANRIHRDDAARAVAHLLTRPEVDPIYLGVDHAPVDLGEVLTFLALELGVPQPPAGDAPSRAGDKRCRNDRLVGSGFTFTYPTYREGYRAVLAGHGVRHP